MFPNAKNQTNQIVIRDIEIRNSHYSDGWDGKLWTAHKIPKILLGTF